MDREQIVNELNSVLGYYKKAFSGKVLTNSETSPDILMEVFGITFSDKIKNMQYWGRELGLCWQKLVQTVLKNHCDNYKPALRIGQDEPCDCIIDDLAIDTKYRVGSGDSGTLKKFKQYGPLLVKNGFQPIMLFLREDNLPAAITALKSGGWKIYTGQKSFDFIKEHSGFDLRDWIISNKDKFGIKSTV